MRDYLVPAIITNNHHILLTILIISCLLLISDRPFAVSIEALLLRRRHGMTDGLSFNHILVSLLLILSLSAMNGLNNI
jgi:hypothetical protein